jgi:putative DNA primase/helicase
VLAIYQEAIDAHSDAERQALARWAAQSEGAPRLRAMVELAQSEPGLPVSPADLDQNLWLINIMNGTLDLRTGTLGAHDPTDLITKMAPVVWDPSAECPRFLAFLHRIFSGNAELLCYLQRQIGYALTGDTGEQKLFLWHGGGANGKSTLLQVVRAMLGDYAACVDFGTFLHQRSEGVRNDLAALQGARFVSAVETRASSD